MTALAVADVNRLGKLLRLLLISEQTGEVLSALAALKRALASAGLDAHGLADIVERGMAPIAHVAEERRCDDEQSTIWFCFHRRHLLTPRDARFVESVVKWSGPLSDRQRKWLFDICDKLAEAA
jgi:hypothetical protein